MQNEWERSLTIKTNYLIIEYQKIVKEFFPGIVNLEEFVAAFSNTFNAYQEVSAKKLDPDSIREKKISCSSAGALLGVWWIHQFPQLTPIFLIEDMKNMGASKAAAHVNVALPMVEPVSTQEALSAFYLRADAPNDIQLIDWTEHSRMKQSNPTKSYDVYPVVGIQGYLRDRLKHLGLPSKYSSKKIEQMLIGENNDRDEVSA